MNRSAEHPLQMLDAKDLTAFMDALAKVFDLQVPLVEGDATRFGPYRKDAPCDFFRTPPAHPTKTLLLPNPEVLFRYTKDAGGRVTLSEGPLNSGLRVALGVRACDVRAFEALDAVFLRRGRADTVYQARRDSLCILGMGCVAPSPLCFCDRMGSYPFDTRGMDVLIVPLTAGWALEALTERGRKVLETAASLLQAASAEEKKQVAALRAKGRERKSGAPVDFTALAGAVAASHEAPFWDNLAARCLGCGICTFVCPVCSCFTLEDTGKTLSGARQRAWDSCMFPAFTREASGHNPRQGMDRRLKQRFFHKFSYSIENGEPPGCVGCGRCVEKCPAAIDIREIVDFFSAEAPDA